MASVNNWVLIVELDGEWEECRFATRNEALAAFVALVKDYTAALKIAVLAVSSHGMLSLVSERSSGVQERLLN